MSEQSFPIPGDGTTFEVVVLDRSMAADGIVTLDLRAPDGGDLPAFDAGAHIDLYLGEGLVRQYSLCNNPSERHRYQVGVLLDRATRGGSAAVHQLRPGDRLRISAPRNAFALQGDQSPVLLVAGGIGITPIKAMAHALEHKGQPFQLHYYARSEEVAAFLGDLSQSPFASQVHFHFDSQGGALPLPPGVLAPAVHGHVYVCGPEGFIRTVVQAALDAGYAEQAVHVEHFAPVDTRQDGDCFLVEAVRSGRKVVVEPGQSIAQALEAAGLQVLTSCEQGLCGTCITPVLGGIPDHRDDYFSEREKQANDKILICCSRSKTAVLQLDI